MNKPVRYQNFGKDYIALDQNGNICGILKKFRFEKPKEEKKVMRSLEKAPDDAKAILLRTRERRSRKKVLGG